MNQIANIKDIKTILIDVSEKINEKNLQEFTYNYLNLKKIDYSKNDLLYSKYLEQSKKYQITIINKKYKYIIPDVFIVYYYDKKDINTYDLFITEDFFVLYKNMNMYYFQELNYSISDTELKEYIFRKLDIHIDNIFQIEKKILLEYKKDFNKDKNKKEVLNLNIQKNSNFNIYLLFLISLLLISVYYFINSSFYMEKENSFIKEKEVNHKYKVFYKEHKFKALENDFLLMMEELEKYKLSLESFEFKEKKVHMVVNSLKKENLYLFLELHKNDVLKNKIEYLEYENKYKVVIDVQLSK